MTAPLWHRLSGSALLAIAVVLAASGTSMILLALPEETEPPSAGSSPSPTPAAADSAVHRESSAPGPSRRVNPGRLATATAAAVGPRARLPTGGLVTATPTTMDAPPLGAGPAADHLIQEGLDQAEPSGLSLPADTAARAVAIGRAVWTADATGVGRERWPDYFTDSAPAAAYTRFRIQAAAAHRDRSQGVVVRLVWAGADPAGTFLEQRTATVRLIRKGTSWTPAQ
ncbi:hypothetical protein ACIP98_29060 [Streptomyces sp. NPDC088354]|uniref:hypothetical protein n=1 Tax=Streptomyces sp. NPDC088354 TaxID=3365856 RepID=UPI00380F12B7